MKRTKGTTPTQTARLVDGFKQLLEASPGDENAIQSYLEEHTELIVTPLLLNHGLHLNAVISKLAISASLISDFAYLTKSTVSWRLVLIELEPASTALFTKKKNLVTESAALKDALAQVRTWRDELNRSSDAIRKAVLPLLCPPQMRANRLEFGFVLIVGRDAELLSNQEHRDRFASYEADDGLIILTYDSLIRGAQLERPKDVLAARGRGFRMKHLNTEPSNTFGFLGPNELELTAPQMERLTSVGYDMEAWQKGELLRVNGKLPSSEADAEFQRLLGKR